MPLKYSEAIPILRSFENEGKRYIYGYACIFDSPDILGTVITREVVETSMAHLRKFPAVRFMHRTPFGQITFDEEVEGVKTFIDSHGFHVLIRVYDQCTKEWSMVKNGRWGFSYGFMPAKDGIQRVCLTTNQCYDGFVKGTLYELSVVDSPAHSDAVAHAHERIQRMIGNGSSSLITNLRKYPASTPEQKSTMIGFDRYIVNEDGTLSVPEPEPKPPKIPDPEPECMLMLRTNEQKRKEKEE